ncbi:MAG TPA: citrate (Si)-synthase, partial [Nocardia sp.]|nr:citrate (Si)-synthase [Nocardia sp.]
MPENHNDAKPVLSYPGGEYAMTITEATEGNHGVDLGKMLASTGYVTYDPGFMNTAPTKSAIT